MSFFRLRAYYSILPFVLLLGCQTPPTQITELDKNQEQRAFESIRLGEAWDLKKSVIIDTRSRFDFEMSKVPRSFHWYWKDWSLQGYRGSELEKRKVQLQRRLARLGVDPFSSIIIFGQGKKGSGEEFLAASILFRLGVSKISVISPQQFKKSLVSKEVKTLSSLPYWEKPLRKSWSCLVKNKKASLVDASSFTKDLRLQKKWTGKVIALKSKKGFWAYGAALQVRKQGKKACVMN